MSHVPDVAVAAATGHNSTRAAASGVRQSTNEVFMVAPTAFGFNDQARAGRAQHHLLAPAHPPDKAWPGTEGY